MTDEERIAKIDETIENTKKLSELYRRKIELLAELVRALNYENNQAKEKLKGQTK